VDADTYSEEPGRCSGAAISRMFSCVVNDRPSSESNGTPRSSRTLIWNSLVLPTGICK
jgi:hypothetical protein